MPRLPKALLTMPPALTAGLRQLGAQLAVARLRRRESLQSWAARLGVSVPTLRRIEAGDPGTGLGLYATALWLIGRDGALATLADPALDAGALDLSVRAATELGAQRARRAEQAAEKVAVVRLARRSSSRRAPGR